MRPSVHPGQMRAEPGCGLEGGGVVPAATARRLACDARIETVLTGPKAG